jgi:hypothetical protein
MFSASVHAVEPAAIYNGGFNSTNTIALRIGNGGAGQSGLIEGISTILVALNKTRNPFLTLSPSSPRQRLHKIQRQKRHRSLRNRLVQIRHYTVNKLPQRRHRRCRHHLHPGRRTNRYQKQHRKVTRLVHLSRPLSPRRSALKPSKPLRNPRYPSPNLKSLHHRRSRNHQSPRALPISLRQISHEYQGVSAVGRDWSSPLGYCVLDLVPPVHCVSDSGVDGCDFAG